MAYSRFIILLLFFSLSSPTVVRAAILSPVQADWLRKHNNTLIVRPEKNYPPFSFVSSSPSIKPKGLSVDYLELVARKVGAQPTYLEAKSRSVIMSEIKSGKEGIILALSETDERSEYLYFSEPFISIPAVIVTRKDFKLNGKELSLADFNARQVAITDDYAVMDYVKNNYQRIIIESVSDDEIGLQKVLLGEVDAAVMDLASLSYYTSRDMLSYVTVAGQTGFDYKLSFAVPKSMPDLQSILNSGLKEITPSERSIIKDRWITFPVKENPSKGLASVFFIGRPLWIGISILGSLILAILLAVIIVHNRKYHRYHVASLSKNIDKKVKVAELTEQLEELESANSELGENIQEIKALEKTIQEKIEHIND